MTMPDVGPSDPGSVSPDPYLDDTEARGLSDREMQVLRLLADGKTNQQIAQRLGISPLTVKSHLARMGRALGTGDRAGMVGAGFRAGYLK